jgi:adenylate cyclase
MAYLEIICGNLKDQKVELIDKFSIGRNPECDLCLNDVSVSRHHAEIVKREDYFSILDLGSSNGTQVNSVPLHKFVPRPLYENDQITVGSYLLQYHSQGMLPPGGVKNNSENKNLEQQSIIEDKHSLSSLALMMQEDKKDPRVNATLDASRSLFFDIKEEKTSVLKDAVKRLQAMVKVSVDLGAVVHTDALLQSIMNGIFDIFPHADRSFILLGNGIDGEMVPAAARQKVKNQVRQDDVFPISKTVIQMVVNQRQSMLLSDAQGDDRFANKKSIVDFSIRSLMCTPIICKEELLGVIGVDTMSREHAFDKDDLAMITGIASQAGIALKNAQLYSAVEKETEKRTQLSRYLSKDVVEGILDGTIPLQLGGEKKKGTILFCDIVGFTSIAEQLNAVDVVSKLNSYYSIITEIITKNRGTLHKFAGDMVMAFWNVMFPDKEASENAVRTGLEMQIAVFLFDLDLEHEGQRPIHLGIGCNTGEFAGGNIGGNERMEYTVIGDNVNLAQRIESLASRWQVLVSEETYNSVQDKCIAVKLPMVSVKGRIQQITVYSIRGFRISEDFMLCSIPVHLLDTDGNVTGSGFIHGFNKTNGNNELNLITHFSITQSTKIIIQFDLPELLESPQILGRVKSLSRKSHSGSAVYTKAVINELSGSMDTFEFFRSGACINSRKNWADMRRY